jgi:uncharacterized protein YlxW (UPF0749 family)
VSRSLRAPRSQLLVASVAFILGLLVVVQIRSQAGGTSLANLTSQDLTFLVANLNTRNDQLRSDISTLQRQFEGLEDGGSRGASSVADIRSDLARIRAWAGLDPVEGDGITVTVSGAVSGPAIEDLLNELRNAGAEAIAIEDVRVVARTVMGGDPGGLSVDDTALGDPFVIRAIGESDALTGSLTRVGGIIAQIAATAPDVTIDVAPTEDLLLPATARDLMPSHGRPRL